MSDEPPRSANRLVELVLLTEDYKTKLSNDPEAFLKDIAKQATRELPPPAWKIDKWIYRIVVTALSMIALYSIFGAIHLAAREMTVPDLLTALGAAAIGALAGLLAPSPK